MSNYEYYSKMYILVRVIALCLFGAHAHGGAHSEPSLWSLAEKSKAKFHARLQKNGNISMAF